MTRWRALCLGRWCVMHYPRAIETAWLICANNSVILTAESFGELIAAVGTRCCHRAAQFILNFRENIDG
jgi:hypothetical protein